MTMSTTVRSTPSEKSGSPARTGVTSPPPWRTDVQAHRVVSTRTSVTGASTSTRSVAPASPCLRERDERGAGRDRGVGAHGQRDGGARARDPHVVAVVGDADARRGRSGAREGDVAHEARERRGSSTVARPLSYSVRAITRRRLYASGGSVRSPAPPGPTRGAPGRRTWPRRRPRRAPRPPRRRRSSASVSPGLMVLSEPVPLASTAPVPIDDRCVSSVAMPGGIGSHDARSVTPSAPWSRSRRGARRSGAPRRRGRGAAASASTPANAGATRAISSCTSSTRLEVEVDAEARARARRRSASRPSTCRRGVTSRATRCTRPSRLVVLPAFSPHTVVGSTRRRARRRRCTNASDRDHEAHDGRAPVGRARGRGSRSSEVGAEQRRGVSIVAVGRGPEDAGGVEPGRAGHRRPTPRGSARAPASSVTRRGGTRA